MSKDSFLIAGADDEERARTALRRLLRSAGSVKSKVTLLAGAQK